jgi:hypothetical protein
VAEKTLILVIGCHRSGTSAVAGCLSAMGVDFGDNLIPPGFDNPRGFFENRKIVAMHDRLLASMGCRWDIPPSPNQHPPLPMKQAALATIGEVVGDLAGPVCGVKDPRATLFVDLWREACEQLGVELRVHRVFREPEDVAASLQVRNGMSDTHAIRLALLYDHAAIQASPDETIRFPDDITEASNFDPTLIHHGRPDDSPPWTVIVPSRSDEKILDFVANLLEAQPEILPDQIVVVSDGLSEETRDALCDVTWVEGKSPFVYPRAINMGAAAADPDSDLVFLGDDVRLIAPYAIEHLQRRSGDAAAVAPEVVGVCGQPAQRVGSPLSEADWLTFVCAYIPRRVWDAVGPLDERFVGYGYDDMDWCVRAKEHGPFRVFHDIRVLHREDSSYRSQDDWEAKYKQNLKIFEDKWGRMTATI